MTAEEIAAWRAKLKLSQKALADALGVHVITVTRWETGARAIPPFLPLALELLAQKIKRRSQK